MRKMSQTILAVLVLFFWAGCSGEPEDRITSVDWSDDGRVAEVSYLDVSGNRESFELLCGDDSVSTPFAYEWEADCDLNTRLRGGSPEDSDNPTDNDVAEAAVGAVVGSLAGLAKKSTKKTGSKKKSYKSSKKKK